MLVFSRAFLLSGLLAAASFASSQAQDEPQSFNAFTIATANGTIVRAAENESLIVGTLAGDLYIETDEGPVESGKVLCAASVRLNPKTYKTSGSGACTFTAQDGAAAWGEWTCEGFQLVGCRGNLKLNGGSGRLSRVAGEGTMIWRPNARELKSQLDGQALQNVTGILLWRDFKIAQKP